MSDVFKEISTFPEVTRHCHLVFDSMAIRHDVKWDDNAQKQMGYCDYGNKVTIQNKNKQASQALVFMLVSLRGTWKWPVGYFLVDAINATVQAQLVKTALVMAQESGIKVWSVTCDGTKVNYSTMTLLGCNLNTTNYCDLKITFKHPSSDCDVYFVPDACHNIKLARNALGDLKILKSPTKQIKWSDIQNLHKLQVDLNLKFANKLSSAHVNYKANIMKVKLAAQTLSSSTASALECLKFLGVEELKDCAGTIEYIKRIDELFDFLNSRNPFGKGFKKPIYCDNITYLQKRMEENIKYLYTLMDSKNNLLCTGQRKVFIVGLAAAVKSILEIAKNILLEDSFKYLLTYRFSQDHVELFFAQIRRRHGWNNNPNVFQFKYAMRHLLVKNSISASVKANCTEFQTENDIGFKLKWNKKNNSKNWYDTYHDKTSTFDDNIDNLFDDADSEELYQKINVNNNFLKENILYYIAGFIVKKIIPKLTCKGCIDNIIKNINERHSTYTILVDVKNNGGLVYASQDVHKIICATETELLMFIKTDKLQEEDTFSKIIYRVTRKYVNTDVFCNNNECFQGLEIGLEIPHRLQLINIICKKYLTLRMYSYSKTLTKDILNPVSKRQKLSKLILFNHT